MTMYCLILLGAAAQAADGKIPEALRRLERAVMGPRTAEIEWSSFMRGKETTYKTRIADDRRIKIRTRQKTFRVPGAAFDLPVTMFIYSSPQENFNRVENTSSANRISGDASDSYVDLRLYSILRMSSGDAPRTVEQALRGSPDDTYSRRYTSEIVDGLHVVTAQVSEERAFRWWIDPKQGWWATRVQHLENGEVLEEQTVRLRQWGDTWFPEEIDFGHEGWGMRIHTASFDQREHSQELTPRDIGIDIGTIIYGAGMRPMRWDGTGPISDREWARLEQAGQIAESETVRQQRALEAKGFTVILSADGAVAVQGTERPPRPATQPSGRIVEVKTFESQWERYTREFIARYSLKDSQEQKAWSILKKCQEQGNAYVKRHRAELDKLEVRVAELSKSTAAADREQLVAARQRFGEKLAPVDAIFENQLKPRLDKLPTRKQRSAVEQSGKLKDNYPGRRAGRPTIEP